MILPYPLFGAFIIQSAIPEWIELEGVYVGKGSEHEFATASVEPGAIGLFLNGVSWNEDVAAVVYNKKTRRVYVKSGCDLNNPDDITIDPDYVSYILKASLSYTQPQVPDSEPTGEFVVQRDGKFYLGGNEFKFLGPNAYWLGLTEEYTYPSREQVEEMFEATKRMSGNSIRSHTLGHSSGTPNSLRPGGNTLNENAWDAIDYAYSLAGKYGIKIIAPLTDGYSWYNGNYGHFCADRGLPKSAFWTDSGVREDFKQYINDYLNHFNPYTNRYIKDEPALGIIELGNELGNIRPDHDSTTIPTRDWLEDISQYIKSIDKNHLVLNPGDESLGQSDEFSISTLDCYSAHFYGKDYDRMQMGIDRSREVGKPYLVGEYSSFSDTDWYNEMERRDVKGSLFWGIYPHQNGMNGGNKIPHEDGHTLHYSRDNEEYLLRISNHFRRMQGIEETNSLEINN